MELLVNGVIIQLPYLAAKKAKVATSNLRDAEVESFISGLGLAKRFNKRFNEKS